MPRRARKYSDSRIYHIVFRGNNRQDIFNDNDDFCKMLDILKECSETGNTRFHAYCLMSNHVHMLLQVGEEPDSDTLSQVMKRIGVRYVKYYNFKYNRIGTLCQDRYKSEAVDTDSYFLAVVRYIHRNPVKAGIVSKPSEYRWSSYNEYTDKAFFVYTNLVNEMLEGCFKEYMDEDEKLQCIDMDEPVSRMTDLQLSKKIEETLRISAPSIITLDRKARNNALKQISMLKGVTYRQISRVTGLSLGTIASIIGN